MRTILDLLEERISEAMTALSGQPECPAIVRPTADPKFGDYQANGVMGLAKKMKTNPRKLAEDLVAKLDLSDLCDAPEIAGPGFINLRLKPEYLNVRLKAMAADIERSDIDPVEVPETVVVDLSSPNVAKQMHVGHLRSTIIGDSLCRLLEFQGHHVIRQNHIGDWGTQFGMLIAFLLEKDPTVGTGGDIEIEDLEQFYRSAKARFDEDPAFADTARQAVVTLQAGDAQSVAVWQRIVDESRRHYQPVYELLSVRLTQENERGESFYNDLLAPVVKTLKDKGLAHVSD
ncbi:MAG: arginine--tRNA ligase, partial [Phycisphaeraceae bacterium]|nr:arginine--tRNA ligase [Phycisphaeraceae bacterium]